MKYFIIILSLLLLMYACPKNIPSQTEVINEISRFFPLKKGYSWSYLLDSIQDNTTSLIKTEVEEVIGYEVKINSNGNIFYYIIDDNGIKKKSAGYYILKQPIKAGSQWEFKTSQFDGRIAIVDINQSIRVRDREFKNCIITEEIIKGQNILLRTYYAEDIGPVLIEQFSLMGEERIPLMRAELLGYSFDPSLNNQKE